MVSDHRTVHKNKKRQGGDKEKIESAVQETLETWSDGPTSSGDPEELVGEPNGKSKNRWGWW